MIALFAAALLVFQQAPTPSQSTEPPQQSQNERRVDTQRSGDPDRVICRRDRVLGSNRPQRVCMTAAQWAVVSEDSRDTARRFERGEMQELPK